MKLLLRHKPKQSLQEIKGILYLCDKDELNCDDCPYSEDMDCHLKRDVLDYLLSYEDIEKQIPDSYFWRYKCPKCEREVDSSFEYCPKCGNKLFWEEINAKYRT